MAEYVTSENVAIRYQLLTFDLSLSGFVLTFLIQHISYTAWPIKVLISARIIGHFYYYYEYLSVFTHHMVT